ncbi:MAG: GNAT family N-acetyltransferase [Actinomycetes bacterium]|jgi:GNAT superfamily N-acetyltransferase
MIDFHVLNSSHEELEDFSLPFAKLLYEAVQSGASMGYLLETPLSELEAFWSSILSDVSHGNAKIVYAQEERVPIGVVVLAFEKNPNAKHRAEVKKLIVAREKQGLGVGKKLLSLLEMEARMSEKSLLILDTETDSVADSLYQSLQWTRLGEMPSHSASPNGELRPTTFYFKELF